MTGVVRPYRGVAAAQRRDQRRRRLLDACLDLVGESGVEAVTAEAVAGRAELSKRYFYESFRDRDAVLAAALDLVLGPIGAELMRGLTEHGGTAERVEYTARLLVRTFTADRRAARLYMSAPGNNALAARRRQMIDEFTPALAREILAAEPGDPEAVATTMLMVAGTAEVLDRWLRGDLALDEEQFVGTLTRLGTRLAGTGEPTTP